MRVSLRCFAVTGLGYVPPWTVNAGFVCGDEITLIIDTGANAAARRAGHEENVFYDATEVANPNMAIREDQVLDLGGCQANINLTPGHTPSNLSIFIPEDRVLFSGDCLINGYLPNLDSGGPTEWRQWLDSLDRIARLAPEVVVAGHGPVA